MNSTAHSYNEKKTYMDYSKRPNNNITLIINNKTPTTPVICNIQNHQHILTYNMQYKQNSKQH